MRTVRELTLITCGSLVTAVGINDLVIPAHLMSGGLAGVCVILYHFWRWPVGTTYFALNVPLLVLAHRYIGRRFSSYTVYSVLALSAFLSLVPIRAYSHDPLLSAVFGGVIAGAGGALVLRTGGSSGGVDIIIRVVAKFRDVSMGRLNLVVNGLIIVASAFMFDVQTAMYTLISIYAGAKVYELVLNHVDRISVLVVTDKGGAVSERIIRSMQRGVTMWTASGAYTQAEKQVLLCVIVNVQLAELRQIVQTEDPQAFLAIVPTQAVVGQFNQVW